MPSDEAAGWGAATAVLVILAIVVVGFAVWLFAFRPVPPPGDTVIIEDRIPDTVVVPQPTPPPDQDVTIVNPPDVRIEAPDVVVPPAPDSGTEAPTNQPSGPRNTLGE